MQHIFLNTLRGARMQAAWWRHAVCASLAFMAGDAALAARLSGTVSGPDGAPMQGAMVTVFNEARDRKETVYTDRVGRYAIQTAFSGHLAVRARAHRFQDMRHEVDAAGDQPRTLDFKLSPYPNAQALSDSLSASAHLTKVSWPDEQTRTTFISQCNYCHQIGNALTRMPKEVSAWEATIARMEGYGAMLTRSESKQLAQGLHKGLDGSAVQIMQKYVATDELARAKFIEWHVGDGMSFVHDTDVGEDGLLYGTDEGHDILWVLDRSSGKVTQYPLPDINLPVGGLFSGMQLPLGVFTGKHGPHSMAQGKDGRIWITNALSSQLMSFDPKTKQFKSYPIGDGNVLYLHTIRIDGAGIVWFTAAASNHVVRFDPKTEKATIIKLPSGGAMRWLVDALFPTSLKLSGKLWPGKNVPVKTSPHKWTQGRLMFNLPYGIDVNPKDGSIWYAKLFANKIGRIDPQTLAITEFDTPAGVGGPRRPRFDKQGILWIPAFDDSALMRFDPATSSFETIKLPVLAAGEYETPYALNVHPQTGEIWITSNMSDRVLRYNPQGKTFVAYPSPTRVMWLRDMVFTKDGQVCSSSSNLPAYGIEDGRGAFVCIDPTGGERDRQAIQPVAASKR